MHMTSSQALILLLPALPVAIWVAWSDLKFMKITNRSVVAMVVVFLLAGAIAFPPEVYIWRLLNLVVILAIGFTANLLRLVGGGDAKYAAAIAPFFAVADFRGILILFAVMLLAAFVTHRIFGKIPAIKKMTVGWASWDAGNDFPMGLALSGTLIAYLVLGVVG